MNVAEFGASIKAKYPQYKDVDDEVLGQKMLEKYPQYASKVDIEATQSAQVQNPYLPQGVLSGQQQPAQTQVNPLIKAGAGVQNFLGKSPLLPIVGAAATRAALPIPGISSFLGAAGGERMKQSMAEGGPMAALKLAIPSLEQNPEVRNQIVKSGGEAAAFDLAATGFGKLLRPMKTLGGIRSNVAAKEAPNVQIDGKKAVEYARKYVKNKIGSGYQDQVLKVIDDKIAPKYSQSFGIDELFEKATVEGKTAFKGSTEIKAGILNKAQAAMQIGIKQAIRDVAPKTANIDAIMSILYKTPKALKTAAYVAGIPASIYYGLKGLRGVGGQ